MQTHHFKSHILATLGLVILVGSLVLSGTLVGHSQGQGFAPVKVVNTSAEPVPVTGAVGLALGNEPIPVQVVDDFAARNPFSRTFVRDFDFGSAGLRLEIEVPEGKRLVIEHVSVRATLPVGQKIRITLGTLVTAYDFVATTVGTFPFFDSHSNPVEQDVLVASEQVRLYADRDVVFELDRNNAFGEGKAIMSISGYLVDAP